MAVIGRAGGRTADVPEADRQFIEDIWKRIDEVLDEMCSITRLSRRREQIKAERRANAEEAALRGRR